uniref:Galectin n=1 Tax=Pelusios castaneus TaxID=367368 RepID=A0A8C8SDA7_9SAUR
MAEKSLPRRKQLEDQNLSWFSTWLITISSIHRCTSFLHSFSINFQCGSCQNPESDIAFHFNPRFEGGGYVVCNTFERQSWGSEEVKKEMPLSKGRPFEILVLVQHDSFLVIFFNIMFYTQIILKWLFLPFTSVNMFPNREGMGMALIFAEILSAVQ